MCELDYIRTARFHAELVFLARLPPLGYSTFFIQPDSERTGPCFSDASNSGANGLPLGSALPGVAVPTTHRRRGRGDDDDERYVTLENGLVSLKFDSKTGKAIEVVEIARQHALSFSLVGSHLMQARFTNLRSGLLSSMESNGVSVTLSTSFSWYNSSDGLDVQENRGQASGAYIFR